MDTCIWNVHLFCTILPYWQMLAMEYALKFESSHDIPTSQMKISLLFVGTGKERYSFISIFFPFIKPQRKFTLI